MFGFSCHCLVIFPLWQDIARGPGGVVDDRLNLDVHAISELQTKGFPPTNDSFKYKYTYDDKGDYSECRPVIPIKGYAQKDWSAVYVRG